MKHLFCLFIATLSIISQGSTLLTGSLASGKPFIIPWMAETTPLGNIVGSLIPNQSGYTTMVCTQTKTGWERTHTINCHAAIPFPEPDGLRTNKKEKK